MSLLIFMPLLYTIHNALSNIILHLYFACFEGVLCGLFHSLTPARFWRLIAGMKTIQLQNQTAIVFAEMPDNQHGTVTTASWNKFVSSLEGTQLTSKNALQLHQNLWQINLRTDMIALAKLVLRAEEAGIRLRVLFLEETPDWTEYPPADEAKTS
jgi:hypothetical protein